jgi:hypothetical protein
MNRLEMKAHISERVPILAKHDEAKWKEAEKLRKQFVSDYPPSKINRLTLDQYVIGKGSLNPSFCYRLERELDSLGRILGATAYKFGVYYGRTKTDPKMMYRFRPHWGANRAAAFTAVKQSIVSLLQAASRHDMAAIRVNMISPMFKGKLLFIYYPEKYAPIYAWPHLEHFLVQLNINGIFDSEADMQRALMNYRETWSALKKQHPCLYMRFLYDLFGYPPSAVATGAAAAVKAPLLHEALNGVAFIDEMPPVSGVVLGPTGTRPGLGDYEAQQKRLKQIGDRGEAIVLEMERLRLTEANRKDLAGKVQHIADRNDSAGFDILSYDEDGSERPIEVKAMSGKTLDRGFYITANEAEKASSLSNYHIYFVFSAMSRKPRVLPVKNPLAKVSNFELRPTAYHATLKARKQE